MNKNRLYIILIGLTAFSGLLLAQDADLKFVNYNTEDGLSQITVHSISEDYLGFMWFGTSDGLNKFNGYEFTWYKNSPHDSLSLSNNVIWDIYEDKNRNFWIGTESGLNLYNREQDNFKSYFHDQNDSSTISNSLIKDILETRNGDIWIASYCGTISRYNPETDDFTNFPVTVVNGEYTNGLINCIEEDNNGNLWVGTEGQGAYLFNPESGEIINYRTDGRFNSLLDNLIRSIHVDSRQNTWFGTAAGLSQLISHEQGFRNYVHEPGVSGTINNGVVESLLEDKEGRLWLGIDGGGLAYFNPSDQSFKHSVHNSQNNSSISSDLIREIYEDSSGNLWIGTFTSGVNLHNRLTEPFLSFFHSKTEPNSLSESKVLSFLEDSEGNFWVGTDGGGLNLFNKKDNTFVSFQNENNNPNSLSSNAVLCLTEDSDGYMWIGTFNGGLNKFNKSTGEFTNYSVDYNDSNSLSNPHVWTIFEDSRENFWVGTMGGGLNLMNRNTGQFTSYQLQTDNPNSISSFLIWELYEDTQGRLWIGTHDGLNLFNNQTKTFISFSHDENDSTSLSNNWVISIFEDSRGTLWVGTFGGGLNQFNPETQSFVHITTKDGLAGNLVFGILEDANKNLWLSTNQGISRFDLLTGEIQNFDQNYGLINQQYNIGAYYKDEKGIMYFGGVSGIDMFDPEKVKINETPPKLVFTKLLVLNKKVNVEEKNGRLGKDISISDRINLSYKDYTFSIGYASLGYFAPDKVSFAYMLERFDRDWNYVGSKREATYTNLDPGEYTFKIKAQNNAGIWSEKETSIKIFIKPPFWKTWWFRVLMIIVFISLLYGTYRLRIKFLNDRELILSQRVSERTAELEEIHEEVIQQKEELQMQTGYLKEVNESLEKSEKELSKSKDHLEKMVQKRTEELRIAKEKAEESDRLKSTFLANMSHEIRTPMNAIVGFSSLLGDAEYEMDEKDFFIDQINSNSQSLLVLIDDILDFSAMEANQPVINKEKFDLNLLLIEMQKFWSLKNNNDQVEIKLNNPAYDKEIQLYSDRHRIKQIISNIIGNALKFTEEGLVEIGLDERGDKIIIYVKDTGIGISKENQEIIFERFRKIESDKNKLFRGVGLGMAISKHLADMLEAELWVESKENVGSTFYLAIPVESNEKIQHNLLKQNAVQAVKFQWKDKRILVAEDEETNYLFLSKALKKTGVSISWAKNGQDAVKFFQSGDSYDVILMDIKMPVMDGYEAAKIIKSLSPEQKIIAQTAYAKAEDKDNIMAAGFDDYLSKPILPSKLLETIQKHL